MKKQGNPRKNWAAVVQGIKNSVEASGGVYIIACKIFPRTCRLHLTGVETPYVLVNMDTEDSKGGSKAVPVSAGDKKCDYLFAGRVQSSNSNWVVLLELKLGDATREVVKQLQAGATAAEHLILPNFF